MIGIDDYATKRNLHAARADAEAFRDFLKKTIGVPDENIICLFDKEATRQDILDGFEKLERITGRYYENKPGRNAEETAGDKPGGQSQEPRLGPCMIIFFAGHGARNTKPDGWGDWAPDSSHVEMLCPSDITIPLGYPVDEKAEPNEEDTKGEPADSSKVVEGIPDRTVCWLLNKLSAKRGNNIVSPLPRDGSEHDSHSHQPRRL